MVKIALLEFIDEFEAFERFVQKRGLKLDDFLIVAVEPLLQSYLKQRNISYKNTVSYFDSNSHRDILIESEKSMQYIRQNSHFIDSNGLKRCYQEDYALYARVFIHHILRILTIISNISKSCRDMELYAFVTNNVSSDRHIADNERYCGILAHRFAKKNRIPFFNINASTVKSRPCSKIGKNYFSKVEKLFFKTAILVFKNNKTILVPQVWGGINKLILDLSKHEKDILFMCIDSKDNLVKNLFFNIASFIKSFVLRKNRRYLRINLKHFNQCLQDKEKKDLSKQLEMFNNKEGEKLFVYKGVYYHDLFIRKVEIALKPYIFDLLSASYALRYIFCNFNRILVISHAGIGNIAIAAELAGVMGKRSLFVSHGTHPVPIDSYHELEMSNMCLTFMLGPFTHVALSTPVQEAHLHYFKNKFRDIENIEIKTGPLIFSSVSSNSKALYKKKLGIPQDTIVLTYSITTKARCANRFYFIETMDEFFSSIADIVKVIEMFDNIKLIIRLHPWLSLKLKIVGGFLKTRAIRTLLPASNKYIINRKGPFSEALRATDILLNYSSTTIDEALINKIPVLLYDKWNRYNHFRTGIFENEQSDDIFPVCYVNNPNKLRSALQFMVKRIKSTKKEDIDVSRYAYSNDNYNNFIDFINESLQQNAVETKKG